MTKTLVSKIGCLVLYALGIAAFLGVPVGGGAITFETLFVAFLVIHVLELPFFWKSLRTYRGSFASSVLQSLLFGGLHALPLLRAAQR